MADFMPGALPAFAEWVQLQQRKRAAHAPTLGWSAADLTRRDQADAAVLQALTDAADAQRKASAAITARDAAMQAYKAAVRTDIARDKTHPQYTDAIGQDLGWLGSGGDAALRPAALKPTLKVQPSPLGVRLDWSKLDQDGVRVYRRRAGEAAWGRPLAFDTRSPYIDTETGLSGPYEYYVQLMKDDEPVGEASDIVRAVHG